MLLSLGTRGLRHHAALMETDQGRRALRTAARFDRTTQRCRPVKKYCDHSLNSQQKQARCLSICGVVAAAVVAFAAFIVLTVFLTFDGVIFKGCSFLRKDS